MSANRILLSVCVLLVSLAFSMAAPRERRQLGAALLGGLVGTGYGYGNEYGYNSEYSSGYTAGEYDSYGYGGYGGYGGYDTDIY